MIASIKINTIPTFTYYVAQMGGTFKFLDVELQSGLARWEVTGITPETALLFPGTVRVS